MQKIFKSRVDFPPPRRLVSGAALCNGAWQLATGIFMCPARSSLLYKSSGPDTVSAQHSKLDIHYSLQGERHALHDDYVSERVPNRKSWLGPRPQIHGGDGQVQLGARESRRAARAR